MPITCWRKCCESWKIAERRHSSMIGCRHSPWHLLIQFSYSENKINIELNSYYSKDTAAQFYGSLRYLNNRTGPNIEFNRAIKPGANQWSCRPRTARWNIISQDRWFLWIRFMLAMAFGISSMILYRMQLWYRKSAPSRKSSSRTISSFRPAPRWLAL